METLGALSLVALGPDSALKWQSGDQEAHFTSQSWKTWFRMAVYRMEAIVGIHHMFLPMDAIASSPYRASYSRAKGKKDCEKGPFLKASLLHCQQSHPTRTPPPSGNPC